MFNLVSLGIEVDIAAKVGQNDVPKYFDYMNLVVVIIFIMELAVAWHIGAVDVSKLKKLFVDSSANRGCSRFPLF